MGRQWRRQKQTGATHTAKEITRVSALEVSSVPAVARNDGKTALWNVEKVTPMRNEHA